MDQCENALLKHYRFVIEAFRLLIIVSVFFMKGLHRLTCSVCGHFISLSCYCDDIVYAHADFTISSLHYAA